MKRICVLEGDGIGPEVSRAAVEVLDALGLNLEWHFHTAGLKSYEACGELLPQWVLKSIEETDATLKGPITTPIGSGFRSINVTLRQHFKLSSNIRPVQTMVTNGKFDAIDLIIFRENTEDLYTGEEFQETPQSAYAIKRISYEASEKIALSAFEYALKMGRKKVTAIHKANIMKLTDGLFLEAARAVAERYPDVEYKELLVDNACMQMVLKPEQFDVVLTTNLYGDILSDLAAGLVGGLGLVPGANLGEKTAIFEAVHGSAPDIAGKNIANPVAMILSGAMLLDYIGECDAGERVRHSVRSVLAEADLNTLTPDLGGRGNTETLTKAIIRGCGIC